MADTVGVREEIEFTNDATGEDYVFTLAPNKIARQRRFMAEWSKMYTLDPDDPDMDKIYDIYVTCVAISLEPQFRKLVDPDLKAFTANGSLTPSFKELVENCFDIPTAKRVIEVCGNLQLDFDPKLMEALTAESQG